MDAPFLIRAILSAIEEKQVIRLTMKGASEMKITTVGVDLAKKA